MHVPLLGTEVLLHSAEHIKVLSVLLVEVGTACTNQLRLVESSKVEDCVTFLRCGFCLDTINNDVFIVPTKRELIFIYLNVYECVLVLGLDTLSPESTIRDKSKGVKSICRK